MKTKILLLAAIIFSTIALINIDKPITIKTNVLEALAQNPDLTGELKLIASDPLTVSASIANSGNATIEVGNILQYKIMIGDSTVLSNTDQFTTMSPGDSFEFQYLIPAEIYQYPEHGEIELLLDPNNEITEANEENNSIKIKY